VKSALIERLPDWLKPTPLQQRYGLRFITGFDDWGRMSADPIEVKLTIFPAFPYTSDEIAEIIQLYHKYEIAHYYVVDAKPYLAVNPKELA